MAKWINVQEGMPSTEIECLVAARDHDLIYTHKTFVQWDGYRWVDVEGTEIQNVIAWTKAPVYFNREEVLKKLRACCDNDKCEERDCLYFVALDLIQELLESE